MGTQQNLFSTKWRHRYCGGGQLRRKRAGRAARPLSSKDPLHVVLKSEHKLFRRPRTYRLIGILIRRYSGKFAVKIEQVSIQHNHIHLLIRAGKRSRFQSFFRVVAGQIAQHVTDTFTAKWEGPKLWKHRPFTRVIKGWKAYQIVKNYIQLNEKEGRREIPYRKERLKGLTIEQLQSLWM